MTNVSIFRTLFLTCHLLLKGAAYVSEENDFVMKDFKDTERIGFILCSMPTCVSNYILCIQALICKQKYTTGGHMLTSSYIFI